MKILIFYPKTGKTQTINVISTEVGPGGLSWEGEKSCGFIGFSSDYIISIVKNP